MQGPAQISHAISARAGRLKQRSALAAYDVVLVARLVFRLAASLPITPHVRYHAIIGNHTRDVPFGHSVQEHPRAIVEIRRILHRQLEQPTIVSP